MSRTLLVLILCLSALRFGASSGSRSILRTVADSNADSGDYALDLNGTSFDAVLRDTPATFAVVEFFAHWCPACRNYKPHYEKVARLFNGPNAVHPGKILMSRVDCAMKASFRVESAPRLMSRGIPPGMPRKPINTDLCDKFSVGHYPMLFWGPPSKFVSGSWDPKQEKSEIHNIDDGRTADKLLNWINKQMGSSFGLDDQTFENEHLPSNVSDPGQIARAVYDVEEATSTAFDIILEHKMIKSETRAPLIKFLQLLVVHHPSMRCRRGSAEILVNFDELSPAVMKQEAASEKGAVKEFQICGKDVPRGYWIFCRGSKNETRGFSCGLWVLLHSLSVRIEDGESQFAFMTICDFIHNFFVCEECRQHFYEMCLSVSSPFNKARDFALWLWRAHNKVNERLSKEEETMGTADPKFPKMIWPPMQLCASCHRSRSSKQIEWDEDEVHKFLTNYYGEMLISLYKSNSALGNAGADRVLDEMATSTNAVAVPVGAALAIALASCAFGVLACYWRSKQKSRKPRRSSELRFSEEDVIRPK